MISEVRQNAGECVKEKVNEGSLRDSWLLSLTLAMTWVTLVLLDHRASG